jgi:ATP-dependent Lon protease
MPRDNQHKMSKNESNNSKRREIETRKKKKNAESSDDNASFYTDDSEDDKMDVHEYRKILKKIFPSKFIDNKIKAGEQLKKNEQLKKKLNNNYYDNDDSCDDDEPPNKNIKKTNKIQTKTKAKKQTKKQKIETDEDYEEDLGSEDTDDDDEDYEEEEDDEEDDEEEEEEEEEDNKKTKSNKFNIVFTIGRKVEDDDELFEDEDEWETDSNTNTENEDDPVSSDSDTHEDEEETPKKINDKKIITRSSTTKSSDKRITDTKTSDTNDSPNEEQDTNIQNGDTILSQLKELVTKNPKDKSIEKCLEIYETNVKNEKIKQDKKIRKEKDRNGRIFKRILSDKNTMNDYDFYDKLDIVQQNKIIKELREINKITRFEKPYRLTLLESDIPVIFKAAAMKKISSLRHMEPGSGEFYKIKNWVDTFMRIPFGEYKTLPISIDDGVDVCHDFMANAQKTLDTAVYGLNDAKMQIMQLLGQLITNPKSIGSAIAIYGPPGTGKTNIIKEGISKILNRPFAFIALGGATDSSFLEGHGYTYEGSTWGKIVQILIDSKCMNPVIYFDELDKISDTPKGEEIAGILTHLTDTSQNMQFHDKYFSEIDFDLSKCLFIFSYNDESKVSPILKDRMYRIQTKGYNQKQKTCISNNYLLPKIREQVKFECEDIIIPDKTLQHIIENHCNKEDGVRNLKRCLEIIHTKLNLYRLMRPDSNLFEEDMSLKVTFPFTVTNDIVDKLIKKTDNGLSPSLYQMYL